MIKTERIPRCQRHPGISNFQAWVQTIQQNKKKLEGAREGVTEVPATEAALVANTWISSLAIFPPPHWPLPFHLPGWHPMVLELSVPDEVVERWIRNRIQVPTQDDGAMAAIRQPGYFVHFGQENGHLGQLDITPAWVV